MASVIMKQTVHYIALKDAATQILIQVYVQSIVQATAFNNVTMKNIAALIVHIQISTKENAQKVVQMIVRNTV